MLATLVAACGATVDETPTRSDTAGPSSGAIDPSTTALPGSTPTDLPPPVPTELPPSDAPMTHTPATSADTGSAADTCTGTDENRAFFAAVADAVTWPVYCPVLARRWFVDSGQYRLAGGGWLEIAYRGPDGARIALREGSYCNGDDCVASGTGLGAADFGDLAGSLLDIGNGGLAILVDPDGANAWEVVGSGLSQDALRSIAADFVLVAG